MTHLPLLRSSFVAGVLAVGLLGSPARAQDQPETPPARPVAIATPAPPPLPRVAITFSPLHLALPVFEVTGEFRLSDHLGLGLVAGYGSVKASDAGAATDVTFDVFEAGTQLRYYVLGDFRSGMQIGAEALYLNVSGGKGSVSAVADGLAVGPFLGYKFTAVVGFTFDAQLGIERVGLAASAKNSSTGAGANASASDWIPLLNLNVGWSL
jgi:hypothetical protein